MPEEDFFEITIDFEKGTGDPARVFKTMTGLIESTQEIDQHLANSISTKVVTSLVLQDIQAGSIKAKLKTVIEHIPDEAIKSFDAKKLIGHFLFKAKHKIIDWCSENDEIENQNKIIQLDNDIKTLAENTGVLQFPSYALIGTNFLLLDINNITKALNNLVEEDKAILLSPEGTSNYNMNLKITDQIVLDLITKETIVSESERILKVKKPDYLGYSKWVFKYSGHLIDVKILHEDWLVKFQKRDFSINPGDSLRVILREEISYGTNNEVVNSKYSIVKVLNIIPMQNYDQGNLFNQ